MSLVHDTDAIVTNLTYLWGTEIDRNSSSSYFSPRLGGKKSKKYGVP